MPIIKRSSCAPHNQDESGTLYDSNGKACIVISSTDKIFIGAAAGVCALVLAVLAAIYIRKWLKSRTTSIGAPSGSRPMSSIGTPLITARYQDSPPMGATPAWSESDHSCAPSAVYTAHSSSDHSHMPVLSANGDLLALSPPEPAWSEDSHKGNRLLPPASSRPFSQSSYYNDGVRNVYSPSVASEHSSEHRNVSPSPAVQDADYYYDAIPGYDRGYQ